MAGKLSLSLSVLIIVGILSKPGTPYVNEWRQPMNFSCPEGQYIRRVYSRRSNTEADRRWSFTCEGGRNRVNPASCTLSPFMNVVKERIRFRCPLHSILVGVRSVYIVQDRQWRFQCCRMMTAWPFPCRWTYFKNSFGRSFDYTANKVIIGWDSIYSSPMRDRQHKFFECRTFGLHHFIQHHFIP